MPGGPPPGLEVRQAFISAFPAITTLATPDGVDVQRAATVLRNGVIYQFGFEGYASNEAVLEIVERTMVFIQIKAPATGTGGRQDSAARNAVAGGGRCSLCRLCRFGPSISVPSVEAGELSQRASRRRFGDIEMDGCERALHQGPVVRCWTDKEP